MPPADAVGCPARLRPSATRDVAAGLGVVSRPPDDLRNVCDVPAGPRVCHVVAYDLTPVTLS